MKTFLIALLGAIMMLFSLSSCTDQYDVDIEYQHKVTLSAENLFKSFYPEKSVDEFENLKECKLNLISLVYDSETGVLVAEAEDYFDNLSSQLVNELNLPYGQYTLVSIARFESNTYHNWDVKNKEKLSTFTIIERDTPDALKYPELGAFETLGFDIRQITVDDSPIIENIDIKPVTALCQIEYYITKIIHRFDGSYAFTNDFSRYYGSFDLMQILQMTYCQKLSIDPERKEPVFGFASQENRFIFSSYAFDFNKPKVDAVSYTYRALLPHGNKAFKWRGLKWKGDYNNPKDWEESGTTQLASGLLNIESGKQYDLSLFYDILFLHACEHDPEMTPEKKVAKCVPFLDGKEQWPEEEQ